MNKNGFYIGGILIDPPTVLAPLAGITNRPFREMVKRMDCGLVCSEMVSANGLKYGSDKTLKMLETGADEHPVSVQIFGSDPEIMADAARKVEAEGADILDINFGCSVKKVTKTGSGVALMKDPELSRRIMEAVRKAIQIPLTIKIRTGWTPTGEQAFHIASLAEACGVDAVSFHPRTAQQGFGGRADRSLIAELKRRITLPVIGNGDITSADDALAMFNETECDGIMIGRASLSSPAIFRETSFKLRNENSQTESPTDRIDIMVRYIEDSLAYYGEAIACRMLRSRLAWLAKGLPGAHSFRKSVASVTARDHLYKILDELRSAQLSSHNSQSEPH